MVSRCRQAPQSPHAARVPERRPPRTAKGSGEILGRSASQSPRAPPPARCPVAARARTPRAHLPHWRYWRYWRYWRQYGMSISDWGTPTTLAALESRGPNADAKNNFHSSIGSEVPSTDLTEWGRGAPRPLSKPRSHLTEAGLARRSRSFHTGGRGPSPQSSQSFEAPQRPETARTNARRSPNIHPGSASPHPSGRDRYLAQAGLARSTRPSPPEDARGKVRPHGLPQRSSAPARPEALGPALRAPGSRSERRFNHESASPLPFHNSSTKRGQV